MDGRHGAFMTGIHCLQHVEGFITPYLTYDDAVGPHSKCVFDQFALPYLSLSFNRWRTRLEPTDVGLLKLQFSGILNCNQPFLRGDVIGKRVKKGRFATARSPRDEN